MHAIEKGKWKRSLPIFWEHEGSRAVRIDNWKLVSEVDSGWELYDMDDDRTELNNLIEKNKPKADEMIGLYGEWAERCEVHPWPLSPGARFMNLRGDHNHSV